MIGRLCLTLGFALALWGTPSLATSIDPEKVTIVQGATGLEIVEKKPASRVFEFQPFAVQHKAGVPGFSDPLGIGMDPLLNLFSGTVYFMDVLGDLHPANPYDPAEFAPSRESLETSQLIDSLLYGFGTPGRKRMIESQLNLAYSSMSKFSNRPQTVETSPLSLAGFGSVSEFAKPVHVHWSHCPDYATRRMLFEKMPEAGRRRPCVKPPCECFII